MEEPATKAKARRAAYAVALCCSTAVLTTMTAAADDGTAQLTNVIDGLRIWLVGILATLATLFLTLAGVRYLAAGGDPGEIEKAKTALRSAAIGYGLAVAAPILVGILQSILNHPGTTA